MAFMVGIPIHHAGVAIGIGQARAIFLAEGGPEDLAQSCRHAGCDRGVVRFSVLCQRHHFEMIKHRECPFTH
jgi:hypothetical protein